MTTTCTLCSMIIYPCEGKQCPTDKCPIHIKPKAEPDNSWALKPMTGIEYEVLLETLKKQSPNKPKIEGM